MSKISRRGAIPPFFVMEVMKAANARAAAGGDVIHLEVGQPSTPAPAPVRKAAEAAKRKAAAEAKRKAEAEAKRKAAEEAKRKAEETLEQRHEGEFDIARAQAELAEAIARLRVVQRIRERQRRGH